VTTAFAEGNSGTTPFTFIVSRGGATSGSATVRYSVAGTTRSFTSADDFAGAVFPSGLVSFAANESTKSIAINVNADTEIEGNERFIVQLASSSGATIAAPDSATAEVLNDDTSAPTPSPRAPATKSGSVVVVAVGENVRSNPGGARIGTQWRGATGVIVGGPAQQDGINWLKIDFESGVDGWVRERTVSSQ